MSGVKNAIRVCQVDGSSTIPAAVFLRVYTGRKLGSGEEPGLAPRYSGT